MPLVIGVLDYYYCSAASAYVCYAVYTYFSSHHRRYVAFDFSPATIDA